MDKQKIKILLISLACVLAIFLIYKVIGKVADNKLEAQGKIDSFNADLENKKTLDGYVSVKKVGKEDKVKFNLYIADTGTIVVDAKMSTKEIKELVKNI
mgnify:CR=1 FL=1